MADKIKQIVDAMTMLSEDTSVPRNIRKGATDAKGRLLGVQFDTLFSPFYGECDAPVPLYFEIGRYGIMMAEKLEKIFRDKGYEFFLDTPTNQKFVLLTDEEAARISEKVVYGFWEKPDDNHTVVRLATSWSTLRYSLSLLTKLASTA